MNTHTAAQGRRTAAFAYLERQIAIDQHLAAIKAGLAKHADRHHAQPLNWGLPGDLAEVERLLAEAARILGAKQAA